MFFKDPVEDGTSVVIPSALTTIAIAVSATLTILLGVFPSPLLNFIETTAFFIR
jgi:NADH-quinone oxidoreductase subunit N